MNEPKNSPRSLFNQASEITDPTEQDAFLTAACGEDSALRQKIDSLLQACQPAGGLAETPEPPAQPKKTIILQLPPMEKSEDRIGRYKLLQQIGEGGCGAVYMAEQQEPVNRRVALKVIKLGMDTKSVVARFEAERQALAMMDHPNIAKVLDAGATDAGRPFFVMELVRGIKITEYCNQSRLATQERLELFIQVCLAIQHAHQKGIIHRDIKPSNILVTLHDGSPVPKVIDFGIAKATQGRLTDNTLFTAFEQFIGTPAYMSPEQAEMSGLDIDTRCDVYALGVLLYELLTGKTPFDAHELVASGLDKMRHTIREQDPQRPSTRLETMVDADLSTTAERCRTNAPKLIHLLKGDLDWIVMKALEKDRTRRYETANALANDVQRYLSNEAVLARPPGGLYRFQKLVRRNQLAFLAGAAVMGALILGLGASTALFLKERNARHRADAAEKVQAGLRKDAEARAFVGEKLGLAALYLTQGKYEESEAEINRLPVSSLSNYVATAFLYTAYADVHARRGEWRKAIANLSNVISIIPTDFPAYQARAALFAQTEDKDDWERDCGLMLHRFAGTPDPVIATRIAETCLVLSPKRSDLDDILKMVAIAFDVSSPHKSWNDVLFVKGLAEYRVGHATNAVESLEKITLESGHWERKAMVQAVLAMAQHDLGQPAESRASLAGAVEIAEHNLQKLDGGLDNKWNDWIIAHRLIEQARALVGNQHQSGVKPQ